MKIQTISLLFFGCALGVSASRAIDLKQAKVTQAVNDVQIISAADQQSKAATVNDVFSMPDILRTGPASRAELVAQDETITRVGANTIFSFDPASRTINLKQGSLLFHSPHGKGGGAIRTGSATASVLGTTLIVSTTAKGGLKVINLEGDVEVKFLNGLKQKLNSGQMTFVLPGGNQLAPIINFRLDELTRNSQLVKGFNQPLASLPLINNQIDKQTKMIHNGKATDTGLYAGDDADSDKVEVVDSDTIHRSPLHEAKKKDATINQPSLLDASIPSPPYHVFPNTPFPLPENPYFSGEYFRGFIARNIIFNTAGPSSPALLVDMSPYAAMSAFDFVALRDILFAGPVTFTGLSPNATLSLIGGRQITFSPGTVVRADVQNFLLRTPAALTLNHVNLLNLSGNIAMTSGADISLQDDSLIQAADNLTLNAASDINLDDSSLMADSLALNTAGSGSVTINNSAVDVTAGMTVNSPGKISIAGSTITGGSITLNSDADISLQDNSLIQAAGNLTLNAGGNISSDNDHLVADTLALATAGSGTVTIKNSVVDVTAGMTVNSPGKISITDSTITSGGITLASDADISLQDNSLIQAAGNLTLNAGGNISSDNDHLVADTLALATSGSGTVTINNSVVDTTSGMTVNSVGNVSVTDSTINSDAASGSVTLGSTSGSATVTGTSITTHYLTVNSGDGILLDAAGHTLTATGPGATANFTAPNLITVNNADFSSFGTVNMAANTINLSDVNLGVGAVTLRSLLGLLNVGSSQSGYVNFIQNVTYNGDLAQNYVNIPPVLGQPPGIIVTTLP